MGPSEAVCVAGLIVICLVACWGLYRQELKLPPRSHHPRAVDYRIASGDYMRFLEDHRTREAVGITPRHHGGKRG